MSKFHVPIYCFDNLNQKYVYLLGEWFVIKNHQYIPTKEIVNICKMVIKEMTFNQVMDCYWNCISIFTQYWINTKVDFVRFDLNGGNS